MPHEVMMQVSQQRRLFRPFSAVQKDYNTESSE